jgi:hypothetical protein
MGILSVKFADMTTGASMQGADMEGWMSDS